MLPISQQTLDENIKKLGVANENRISIRETVRLANMLEKESNEKFIRLEMGVPGLKPPQIAIEAEHNANLKGLGAIYPPVNGIDELKEETSKFAKNFINIDVPPECCLPATGSMQGCFAAFMVANRTDAKKGKTLFIDPGFPVNKAQLRALGMEFYTFDVYNYRGEKLEAKLEEFLSKGDVSTILYSSPNNPSWINFTNQELEIIGKMADKYNAIVIEDLAYFGMDLRRDISQPGQPPYNPSVANYTKNFIILLSGSKAFSYAGQRISMMLISPTIFNSNYPDLLKYFGNANFGHAMIFDALYTLSTGTTHSVQCGFAAILRACNNGDYNFVNDVREYAKRAKYLKEQFLNNGFSIVYDLDGNQPIGDGFYFTVKYPGLTGTQLIKKMLRYGISAIGLNICGSEHSDGLRICVSQLSEDLFPVVKQRLEMFHNGE